MTTKTLKTCLSLIATTSFAAVCSGGALAKNIDLRSIWSHDVAQRTADCIVNNNGGYFRVLIDEAKQKSNGEICYPDINQNTCIPKRKCIRWG
jgi:hypothetical protein